MMRNTFVILIFLVIGYFIARGIYKDKIESIVPSSPNYADSQCWAMSAQDITHKVDVFYVYPTVYSNDKIFNMDIYTQANRESAMNTINQQIGVFSDYTNVYVPYYRQVARNAFSFSDDTLQPCLDIAFNDVSDAFKYYINNMNEGRPFILAGHSQGSALLLDLMRSGKKDTVKCFEIADKMVAAYIIGSTLMPQDTVDYSWMKLAKSASDIGGIIIYNSMAPEGKVEESPCLEKGALCVNPLSWKNDTLYTPKEENDGAVWCNNDGSIKETIPNFTDAQVRSDGALILTTPDVDEYSDTTKLPYGIYHEYDYVFFYNNLKENVETRIEAYLNRHKIVSK